ncbi:MAG TPA: hypothetical protein DCR14_00125 [Acidimicrobiaceae bacterium]|nr:hypothetical protein [Acidimicrobiaceae bacterium]
MSKETSTMIADAVVLAVRQTGGRTPDGRVVAVVDLTLLADSVAPRRVTTSWAVDPVHLDELFPGNTISVWLIGEPATATPEFVTTSTRSPE